MTKEFTARPAGADAYALGEGPVWDPDRHRLVWVDILGSRVFAGELTPTSLRVTDSWEFEGYVGAAVVGSDGSLLVAEREVLTRIAPGGGRREVARVLPAGGPSRLNDGKVDPRGRFVVGAMALDDRKGEEVLVRLDPDGLTTLDDDLTLSNGLAWSPSGETFYSIDSVPGVVHARAYPSGARRDLFTVDDGLPDGMCADVDGNLWIAIYGGGRVECRTPDGTLLATVAVDAPHPTAPAFAGPGLDILVITTATAQLSAGQLARHPDSGRVFTAQVGVAGLPTPYWEP